MRLNNYHTHFYSKINSYLIFNCGSLNALGGKYLISRSINYYLLKTYNLILHILLSKYKLNFNHDVFGMNTRLVIIGVKYCQLISAV
jgi:hypothetical protein